MLKRNTSLKLHCIISTHLRAWRLQVRRWWKLIQRTYRDRDGISCERGTQNKNDHKYQEKRVLNLQAYKSLEWPDIEICQVPWNSWFWMHVVPLRSGPIWDEVFLMSFRPFKHICAGTGATDEQYLKRLQIFCTASLANISIMELSCIETRNIIMNKTKTLKFFLKM